MHVAVREPWVPGVSPLSPGEIREKEIVTDLRAHGWAVQTSDELNYQKKIDFVVFRTRDFVPARPVEVQLTFTTFYRDKLRSFIGKQGVRGGSEWRLYMEVGREDWYGRRASNDFVRAGIERAILRIANAEAAPGSIWAARIGLPSGHQFLRAEEYLAELDRLADGRRSRQYRMGGFVTNFIGENGFTVFSSLGFEFLGFFSDLASHRHRERLRALKDAGVSLATRESMGGYVSFIPRDPWIPGVRRATLIRAARTEYPDSPVGVREVE